METNDINNPNSTEHTSPVITDNDLDAILEENGFTEDNDPLELGIGDREIEDRDDVILDPVFEDDDLEVVESTPPTPPTQPTSPTPPTSLTPLPLNSPSLLVDEATTRFSGASWFDEIQKSRVIIAGIGGIGSNVAFQLARMAPANITLYDDDVVERVNMAGQLYSTNDIGQRKVDAIASMISAYTLARQVNAVSSKFTDSTEAGDIMICGFDNMFARKTFYNSWKRHIQTLTPDSRAKCLFLDGRLSIDTLQIFCIQGDDKVSMDRYEIEFLFSDFQAEHTVCSMKQTTYLACMIGSLMVNLFTNFIANSLNPIIPYDLPFFTEYDSPNMLFKTQS